MMGSLLLDKIIQHNKLNPAEILLHLNNDIVRILDQKDGGEIQDGMDLSICVINKNTKEMSFSGARNGILIDHNGKLERYEETSVRRNEKTKFLEDEFDEWKGEFPQIDDLLIIGFQV